MFANDKSHNRGEAESRLPNPVFIALGRGGPGVNYSLSRMWLKLTDASGLALLFPGCLPAWDTFPHVPPTPARGGQSCYFVASAEIMLQEFLASLSSNSKHQRTESSLAQPWL